MSKKLVSFYKNSFDRKGEEYDLDSFLNNIQAGVWQDQVLKVRISPDEETKSKNKKILPSISVSGLFNERKDSELKEHSNFIAIDFDNLEDKVNETKDLLNQDPYVYCVFVSCSGRGLCAIIKIDGKKHREAFAGLQEYFYVKYSLIVDPSGKNESRLRYASYDPHIEIHEGCKVFKIYPEKQKRVDTKNVYYGSHDLDHVFEQIQNRGVDITGGYQQWLSICFAICDHYGESGRDLMHMVSSMGPSYDAKKADRQYTACLKHQGHATKKNSIATFLYYAKQAGIEICSPTTRTIVASAKMGRNGSNTVEGTLRGLKEFEGIDEETARPIVEQIFSEPKEASEDQIPLIIRLHRYWKEYQASIRRNVINKKCYRGNIPLTERDLIDIYVDASMKLNANVTKEMVADTFKSSIVPEFNPLKDFFSSMSNPTAGNIKRLSSSIASPQGENLTEYILTKWLVSCVASVYGKPNEVMLAFTGKQGTGKSYFFANLLPENFPFRKELVVEDYLRRNADQNNKLLMAQKFICIDDEFRSITAIGEDDLKAAITEKNISIRMAYERTHDTVSRLCNFVGTTNNNSFLKDMSGNRRFPIIEIEHIDHAIYNSVDKYELWKEAYFLYLDNSDHTFNSADFALINENADQYIERSFEQELLLKHFENNENGIFMTSTDIVNILQQKSTFRNLSSVKMGKALAALGWKRCKVGRDRSGKYGYFVSEI